MLDKKVWFNNKYIKIKYNQKLIKIFYKSFQVFFYIYKHVFKLKLLNKSKTYNIFYILLLK